ncbi:MAG TPA: saccharopine dehydrogenase NADP-binding domain-containing protein [Polyangiales bacterium]|nr:saccharopine dehydrogenase NADP-binding domain-containing protein [Polyangiales bacterium]
MSEATRDYDLLVFGATGFTGGMTAEYLARHAPPELRWAIAGRSASKLQSVKERLLALNPACAAVGCVEASVDDPESLQRMAAKTRVLITTVGPFIDYGEPVVRACVEQRTDYIDSTGEPNFLRLLFGRYAEAAEQRGVRLVPCCGFDSIPADLGALFTVLQLPSDQPIELSGFMSVKAQFSGGTERSAIKSAAPPEPGLPAPEFRASDGRRVAMLPTKVEHRREFGQWSTPLPTVDATVVLRSASKLRRYGPDFRYGHNALHASFGIMLAAFVVFGLLGVLARFKPTREFLLKVVKKSGQGPSQATMAESWFKLRFIAKCAGKTLQTEVSGGDPGYAETSKMLAESGMCLAQDRDSLPNAAGVLTPAHAMGEALLARLQRAGLSFRVLS